MKVVCFDLDDTLYKEIDYLKSAYKEVASYAARMCTGTSVPVRVLEVKAYEAMLEAYYTGNNAFETLNTYLGLNLPIGDLLHMYREHQPNISLVAGAFEYLTCLKKQGCVIGIITDGRSVQQRNKIKALRITEFVKDGDVIISGEFGSEKPSEDNYRYFMERYPQAESFTYIGDNISKDFWAPNRLGWITVCIMDNGENIHKQDFTKNQEYLPHFCYECFDCCKKQ